MYHLRRQTYAIKTSPVLLGLLPVALGYSWMFAQETNDPKSKSDTRTITGCLTKEHDSSTSKST